LSQVTALKATTRSLQLFAAAHIREREKKEDDGHGDKNKIKQLLSP
jgi:hypothetical protein